MRVRKADNNQSSLVKQMRKIPGLTVALTHTVGNGFGDAVIGFRGRNYLVEIKDPSKPPSAKKLTPDEQRFHDEWTGQISVIETIDDVMKIINV
jgi:hypothetical protein